MCRCFIATFEFTVIVNGTVRVNCGECGKYQYHLVDGIVKHLKRDPVTVTQTSCKKPKSVEARKRQEKQAMKRLEVIRQELEKFHEEASS